MSIYLIVNILILLITFLFFLFSYNKILAKYKETNQLDDFSNSIIYLFIIFILLVFISGFRGGFSPDYYNYVWLFNTSSRLSLTDILKGNLDLEIGYAILNKIISFFSKSSVFLMIIISSIILFCYFYQFKKYSLKVWLSIFLLVTVCSYYTSFNLIRQFLAGALFFCAVNFIYKRDFFKYVIAILMITLIHKSAIFMLPFYFLLQIRWNKIKNIIFLVVIFFAFMISFIYYDFIVDLFITSFYTGYAKDDAFGINNGVSVFYIFRPTLFIAFNLLFIQFIDFSKIEDRVWFNASIFFLGFSLLSTRVEMLQRFTFYFSPFATLIIPRIISNIEDYRIRKITVFLVTVSAFMYSFLTQRTEIFYFIWQ